MSATDKWWEPAVRDVFGGRPVILAGAVPAAWNEHVTHLAAAGAGPFLVVATDGAGVGPGPDVTTVVVDPPASAGMMERIRVANATIADPPEHVVAAVEAFDAERTAVVVASFLNESPTFADRRVLAHRRPEWVRLEDKTVVDALWDRAGVPRLPSAVVPIEDARATAAAIDRGTGTVWAGDAREGFHGGGHLTRLVHDDRTATLAASDVADHCDLVRVMPYAKGIPCSVHAVVLPDGNAVLRPVEMVTLRHADGFTYAGCATFWDPPPPIREQMRAAARRTAQLLRAEVGFRGTFTIDGVAAADGFWPTELNPRYGAGINVIARAVGDIPILLLHDLAVAGHSVGSDAATFEQTLVTAADAHRSGGTWVIDRPSVTHPAAPVAFDGHTWRWHADEDDADGTATSGPNFARCAFDPTRTPIGPSVAGRAAAFWNSVGRELGVALPTVRPAEDPFAAPVVIRPELGDDDRETDAIDRLIAAAFGSPAEARLVRAIRTSEQYHPDASLVAERGGVIVGHVMLSTAWLADGEVTHEVLILSPLSVAPAHQRTGVGSALVDAAVAVAERAGAAMVVLEGSPDYYGRLGFEWAVPHGITIDLPDWASPAAAQVRRLTRYDPAIRGHLEYPPAFAEVVDG